MSEKDTFQTERHDRFIDAMDKLIALGEKMNAAEKAWENDPWDGESIQGEERNHRLRTRYFRAEEAVSKAIPKFLKQIGVGGFV